jgi:glycogen(starch) synthase
MYPPHHLGGYELTWRSAVEHLRAAGHAVRVLTTDYRHPEPDSNNADDPDVHRELRWYWRDHEFPRLSLRERVELERHNGRVLERHLRELRPDVANWWAMGGMSLSLIERVARRGVPAVGVVGDDWMVYGPKVDAWIRFARRLGLLAPLAGWLVGVPAGLDLSGVIWLFNSDATRRRGREAGCRLEHAELAHPGIDTVLFTAAPERAWGWRLLYVGRIDERKGIDAAVEALAQLPEEARLTVLGSGDEAFLRQLRELCARLGVDTRVEFGVRPHEELAGAYARADVLLFPVRWEEPWGLVPLEAMAVGTPVVATGTGGSGEYLRDGENALVVGRGAGPEKLAAAVRRLASEPVLRARLREGGRRTAARYSERAYNEAIEAALLRASGRHESVGGAR